MTTLSMSPTCRSIDGWVRLVWHPPSPYPTSRNGLLHHALGFAHGSPMVRLEIRGVREVDWFPPIDGWTTPRPRTGHETGKW